MVTSAWIYTMLGNAPLWETALRCRDLLSAEQIAHAVIGGVAVCLHGYRRNTIDLNLLIRQSDAPRMRQLLGNANFQWNDERHEFAAPARVPVQFLDAGERAGSGSEVRLPDPADERALTQIEGLTVLSLARLIEAKLACGEGNLRRTHKDFADVVELIAVNGLDGSFARHLHKSLRKTYRELAARAGS